MMLLSLLLVFASLTLCSSMPPDDGNVVAKSTTSVQGKLSLQEQFALIMAIAEFGDCKYAQIIFMRGDRSLMGVKSIKDQIKRKKKMTKKQRQRRLKNQRNRDNKMWKEGCAWTTLTMRLLQKGEVRKDIDEFKRWNSVVASVIVEDDEAMEDDDVDTVAEEKRLYDFLIFVKYILDEKDSLGRKYSNWYAEKLKELGAISARLHEITQLLDEEIEKVKGELKKRSNSLILSEMKAHLELFRDLTENKYNTMNGIKKILANKPSSKEKEQKDVFLANAIAKGEVSSLKEVVEALEMELQWRSEIESKIHTLEALLERKKIYEEINAIDSSNVKYSFAAGKDVHGNLEKIKKIKEIANDGGKSIYESFVEYFTEIKRYMKLDSKKLEILEAKFKVFYEKIEDIFAASGKFASKENLNRNVIDAQWFAIMIDFSNAMIELKAVFEKVEKFKAMV